MNQIAYFCVGKITDPMLIAMLLFSFRLFGYSVPVDVLV